MNGRTQQILLHIAGCMVFLALPILFSPESLSLYSYFRNPPTQRDFIIYALMIAVFYANYYLFIPNLYFKRRYPAFFLLAIGCFLFINFLPAIIPGQGAPFASASPGGFPPFAGQSHTRAPDQRPATIPGQNHAPLSGPPRTAAEDPPPVRHHPLFIDTDRHLFLFLVVIFFALMLKIRERWKLTEREKIAAELSYLKAQINPHFLFNTLNSIYSLTLEKSDQAPTAIVQLSGMMRYVLDEAGKDMVPLDKEIAYIRNYIALQEARFGASLHLDCSVSGSPEGKKIAPLVLIPFIENAFKHGINADEDALIRIRIGIDPKELRLEVFNKKVSLMKHAAPDHSGLGIMNTKNRLILLYPHDHTLNIKDGEADFLVLLTLKLNDKGHRHR